MFKQVYFALKHSDVTGSLSTAPLNPLHSSGAIRVAIHDCRQCTMCVKICPSKALDIVEDHGTWLVWRPGRCVACVRCVEVCNNKALSFIPSDQAFMLGPSTGEERLVQFPQENRKGGSCEHAS